MDDERGSARLRKRKKSTQREKTKHPIMPASKNEGYGGGDTRELKKPTINEKAKIWKSM